MNNYVTHTQLAIKLFAFETKINRRIDQRHTRSATSEKLQEILKEISIKFEQIDKRLDQMATKEMVQQILTLLQAK